MSARPRILVMTPIEGIDGLRNALEKIGDVVYVPDPSREEALASLKGIHAIFTNPNKSRVYLSEDVLGASRDLRVVCTASTGTNHIDQEAARRRNIRVLSITEERDAIDRISSTAEHAFALFLSALRKVPQSWDSVQKGHWDYEPFVGRQVSALTVGVIGYGRLGRFFARYAKAFGATVLATDPYKKEYEPGVQPVTLEDLLEKCDVVSLHVHVTPETTHLINRDRLSRMKAGVLIINTSRGEIVDESALVEFLRQHPSAFYATDVLSGETKERGQSPVLKHVSSGQILITPHVGGMTTDARHIAYHRAALLLERFFREGAAR